MDVESPGNGVALGLSGSAPVLPSAFVPPGETSELAGLSAAEPTRHPGERLVAEALVRTARAQCEALLAGVTLENAPRVLTQVGALALTMRKLLPKFAEIPLAQELEGLPPRRRRAALLGEDRETGGVHALHLLVAEWRRASRPKRLADMLVAVEALERRARAIATPENETPPEALAVLAQASSLRGRADELAQQIITDASPEAAGAAVAHAIGHAATGASPDLFETALGHPEIGVGLESLAQLGPLSTGQGIDEDDEVYDGFADPNFASDPSTEDE